MTSRDSMRLEVESTLKMIRQNPIAALYDVKPIMIQGVWDMLIKAYRLGRLRAVVRELRHVVQAWDDTSGTRFKREYESREFIKGNPGCEMAYRLAESLRNVRSYLRDREALEGTHKIASLVIELLEMAVANDRPSHSHGVAELAMMYVEQRLFRRGYKFFKKLSCTYGLEVLDHGRMVRKLDKILLEATAMMDADRNDEAATKLREIISMEEDKLLKYWGAPAAYVNLSAIYCRFGRKDVALFLLQTAERLFPERADIYYIESFLCDSDPGREMDVLTKYVQLVNPNTGLTAIRILSGHDADWLIGAYSRLTLLHRNAGNADKAEECERLSELLRAKQIASSRDRDSSAHGNVAQAAAPVVKSSIRSLLKKLRIEAPVPLAIIGYFCGIVALVMLGVIVYYGGVAFISSVFPNRPVKTSPRHLRITSFPPDAVVEFENKIKGRTPTIIRFTHSADDPDTVRIRVIPPMLSKRDTVFADEFISSSMKIMKEHGDGEIEAESCAFYLAPEQYLLYKRKQRYVHTLLLSSHDLLRLKEDTLRRHFNLYRMPGAPGQEVKRESLVDPLSR